MKNFKKFIFLAIGMILSVCLLCACVETNDGSQSEELHVCKHVCETCGKCTDEACKNEVCKDKCKGHTPVEKTYNLKVMSFNLDQGNGSNAAMNKKVYEKNRRRASRPSRCSGGNPRMEKLSRKSFATGGICPRRKIPRDRSEPRLLRIQRGFVRLLQRR